MEKGGRFVIKNCERIFGVEKLFSVQNSDKYLSNVKFWSFNSARVKLGVYESISWFLFDFLYF